MNQEKRKYPRYPFIEQVTVITPTEKSFIFQSENLSLGGIYLIKEDPLPPGTSGLLSLTLNMGDAKKDITTKFKVVHNGRSREGKSGMGVAFIDLPEEVEEILQKVIEGMD